MTENTEKYITFSVPIEKQENGVEKENRKWSCIDSVIIGMNKMNLVRLSNETFDSIKK